MYLSLCIFNIKIVILKKEFLDTGILDLRNNTERIDYNNPYDNIKVYFIFSLQQELPVVS